MHTNDNLVAALCDLLTAFQDLLNGYPEDELHEPPDELKRKAKEALAEVLGRDEVVEQWGDF